MYEFNVVMNRSILIKLRGNKYTCISHQMILKKYMIASSGLKNLRFSKYFVDVTRVWSNLKENFEQLRFKNFVG